MKPITILLSTLFIFLAITTNGQDLFFRKGQLKLSITGSDCKFEAKNRTIRASLNAKTGACSMNIPVVAFQLEKPGAKKQSIKSCFSTKDHPMITFEGKLTGIENVKGLTNGTYPAKLEGQWNINGESMDLSENVQLHIENRQLSLAFNTTASIEEMKIEIDCEMAYGERVMDQ